MTRKGRYRGISTRERAEETAECKSKRGNQLEVKKVNIPNRKIIAWVILVIPAMLYIGYRLDYSFWALLVGMGYGIMTVYLLFWNELMIGKGDEN